MGFTDRLSNLHNDQKKLLDEYEKLLQDAEAVSSLKENEKLKKELETIKKELAETGKIKDRLDEENKLLKITIKEQVIDEKLNILKMSKDRLDLYFKKKKGESVNALNILENNLVSKADDLANVISQNAAKEKNDLMPEIDRLKSSINERINRQRELLKSEENKYAEKLKEEYSVLDDEETVKKRIKRSRVEMKVGMNWINWIGIVLILIGTGFVVKLSYSHINEYIKGGFIFILGLLFLGAGEFFFRKQKKNFSKGLIGGGIAILFGGIFYSYFFLKIITNEYIALFISLLVIIITILLSLRYDSKTIISIGLIGVYLPFLTFALAFGISSEQFYYAMGYLFLGNLIILVISIVKRWSIPLFISFGLNVPSLVYLSFRCDQPAAGIAYSIVTFIMYIVMIMGNPFIYKKPLRVADVILLSLNTIASTLIIYALFAKTGLENFEGAFMMIFAVIYIGLGLSTSFIIKTEFKTVILFYITALTFAVLIIPFQFGLKWLSMGWLTEGALLVIAGYKFRIKYMELAGWIVTGLFAAIFYYYELFGGFVLNLDIEYFDFKFFIVTLYAVIIFIIYQADLLRNAVPDFPGRSFLVKGLKYFSAINLYAFLIYITLKYFYKLSGNQIPYDTADFFASMIFAVITLSYGLIITQIKVISDGVINVMGIILKSLSLASCFFMLLFSPPALTAVDSVFLKITALVLLIAYNVIILFVVRDLAVKFVRQMKITAEIVPVILSVFIIGSVTPFIVRQFEYENIGVIITFAYLVIALLSISYGFYKRYLYIRYFGLGLTFVSLAKFFIYDLRFLDTAWKIISYFGFGLLLILISFVYQTINNKLKENDVKENKEDEKN